MRNNDALSNARKIILTSDGVHEHVLIDELEDEINNENISPLQICEKIINIAKRNGSADDKSIVIVER